MTAFGMAFGAGAATGFAAATTGTAGCGGTDEAGLLPRRINAVTVSMDLPFAMNRFCGAESIKNMKVGSDYQDRNFGTNYGTLIEELKIECRAVFVLDKSGKVVHAEYVKEVTTEPDYEAAIGALKSQL